MDNVYSYFIFLIFLLFWTNIHSVQDSSEMENDSKAVIIPGDLLLGGLFPIHFKDRTGHCSKKINVDGILALEAFLHTLDLVNPAFQKATGITLGAIALDTCASDRVALFSALKFVIKDYLKRKQRQGEDPNLVGENVPAIAAENIVENATEIGYSNVVGVVGPLISSVTVQVASLLSLFKMPQISYAATSSTLSKRSTYPYFFRTVPSDKNQAWTLVEILKTWNWTYVIGAYEDNNFGAQGFHDFEKAADSAHICIAARWKLNVDQSDSTFKDIRVKLRKFAEDAPEARAFVLFVRAPLFDTIIKAATAEALEDWFVFIGTDGWGNAVVPVGLEGTVEGAIASLPIQRRFTSFMHYFYSLKPSTNGRNVWFREFWRSIFKCESAEEDTVCWKKGKLKHAIRNARFGSLHAVRDAVLAFATALQRMHESGCHGGRRGLCYRMRKWIGEPDREVMLEYLQNASFAGLDGPEMFFFDGHDVIPRYTIMNYQRIVSKRGNGTEFDWVPIGSIQAEMRPGQRPKVRFEHSGTNPRYIKARFKYNTSTEFPLSNCGSPCPIGHIRRHTKNKCCWTCEPCPFPTYPVNESHCDMCPILNPDGPDPKFFRPSPTLDHCEPIQADFVHCFNNAVVGVVAVASSIGLLLTTLTFILFLYYSRTPIIKASGRELSVLLLIGIAVSYSTVFIVGSSPNAFTCAIAKFLYSTGYTLCYGSIFIKTNRIARIFRPSTISSYLSFRRSSLRQETKQVQSFQSIMGTRRARYISPISQILFVIGLVIFQWVINAIWFILRPPSAGYKIHFDYERQKVNLYKFCRGFANDDMIIALLFPVTLLLFASFYAFKTRKCPGKFNEMKYIIITTYTACIVWLAFIPVFFTTEQLHLRIYAMCASLCINATVTLFCMFAPKLFVAVYRPEKNTKDVVMGRKDRTVSTPSSPYQNYPSFPQWSIHSTRSSVASAFGMDNTDVNGKEGQCSDQLQPLLAPPTNKISWQLSSASESEERKDSRVPVPNIRLTLTESRNDSEDTVCRCRRRRRSL